MNTATTAAKNLYAQLTLAAYLAQSGQLVTELTKELQRGDSDSAGSTMRTAGIVALVLVIFAAIAAAVAALAKATGAKITTPAF